MRKILLWEFRGGKWCRKAEGCLGLAAWAGTEEMQTFTVSALPQDR